MSVARFNVDYLMSLKDDSFQINTEISYSTKEFESITLKMQELNNVFNDEVKHKIDKINSDIKDIRSYYPRIQSKIQSLQSAINSERSNKEPNSSKIAKYAQAIQRCNEIYQELKNIESNLYELGNSIVSTAQSGSSSMNSYVSKNRQIISDNLLITNTSNEFVNIMSITVERALLVHNMNPSRIRPDGSIESAGKIRNNHSHFATSSNRGSSNSSSRSVSSTINNVNEAKSEEILIKNRDINSFLEEIANVNIFKMPSSNFHKLGGKQFISKMNDIGYFIKEINGSMIDSSGMIHWEKK